MKFISKSSNLLVVLRPGSSAQPITGTPAKPTVSVRFKDGIAEVNEKELVAMMLAHPGFNGDFISAEDIPVDPFAGSRQPSEPAHTVTELKFGTPVARETKGGGSQLPPELQKIVQGMAAEMAKQMLPSMVEKTLKSIVESRGTQPKAKKKPGRKPKNKIEKKAEDVQNVNESIPGPIESTSNPAVKEDA